MGEVVGETLMLVETAERIFIHPVQFSNNSRFVVINRITDEISVENDFNQIPDGGRIRTVCVSGIVGILNLIAGPYLILVKSGVRIGDLNNNAIFKMEQYEVVPFKKSLLHLSEKQRQLNQIYVEMIDSVLTTPYFYYSHSYDLSHNLQSLNFNSPDFFKQSLIARAEEKFIWNSYLLTPFINKPELHKFCIPLIHGFISVNETMMKTSPLKIILISRRSSKRPGMRLFCRGIDSQGHVSNFVETEQLVEYNGQITSFLQTRGSIPLFWTQRPNLKYKPAPAIEPVAHDTAFRKHMDDLLLRYNRIVCIDLVNQTGSEAILEVAFEDQVNRAGLTGARYEKFDFHHECKNMRWDRLEILTNRLMGELEEFSYYMQAHGQTVMSQEGVFRTNCIDCLDRTNVVQGMLGKINLEKVLKRFGLLIELEKVSDHPSLEFLFKNIWADNGDVCSIEYSGTGALKTDFTRTGKRSFAGVMSDGYNSAVRYFKNNFNDGYKQDAMNLFLGNYIVKNGEGLEISSPLEKNRDWKFYSFPLFLIISMIMTTMLVVVPSEYSTETLLYLLFWAPMFVITGGVIVSHGTEYVDNPVLCPQNTKSLEN